MSRISTTSDSLWTLDGTTEATNTDSVTYQINNTYDVFRATFRVTNNSGSDFITAVRINGDSGQNYDLIKKSGSTDTGVSYVELDRIETGGKQTMSFETTGRWPNACKIGPSNVSGINTQASSGAENASVTSPLSSITVYCRGANIMDNIKLTVRGRNA